MIRLRKGFNMNVNISKITAAVLAVCACLLTTGCGAKEETDNSASTETDMSVELPIGSDEKTESVEPVASDTSVLDDDSAELGTVSEDNADAIDTADNTAADDNMVIPTGGNGGIVPLTAESIQTIYDSFTAISASDDILSTLENTDNLMMYGTPYSYKNTLLPDDYRIKYPSVSTSGDDHDNYVFRGIMNNRMYVLRIYTIGNAKKGVESTGCSYHAYSVQSVNFNSNEATRAFYLAEDELYSKLVMTAEQIYRQAESLSGSDDVNDAVMYRTVDEFISAIDDWKTGDAESIGSIPSKMTELINMGSDIIANADDADTIDLGNVSGGEDNNADNEDIETIDLDNLTDADQSDSDAADTDSSQSDADSSTFVTNPYEGLSPEMKFTKMALDYRLQGDKSIEFECLKLSPLRKYRVTIYTDLHCEMVCTWYSDADYVAAGSPNKIFKFSITEDTYNDIIDDVNYALDSSNSFSDRRSHSASVATVMEKYISD